MRTSIRVAALAALLTAASAALGPPAVAQTTASGRVQPPALVAFANAWGGVTGYSATVAVFERKDAQSQNVLFDYAFRKPSSATVHVAAGPNAGVTLAWDGGTTMVAHRGTGLAALFKRTIALHDPLATTLRGSSIDQLSFGAILAHGEQTAGTISQGQVVDGGVVVDAITIVPAVPAADVGLTREIVELSATTHLPTRVIGYEGATLVRSIEFADVKLDR
jgi:hypothetical protein